MIVLTLLAWSSLAGMAATPPLRQQAELDRTVRCLALDDVYWAMIMTAGAGERSELDGAWSKKMEGRMLAEGAKLGWSKERVWARYSAVFNPLQNTVLDDALMAERNKCRAAKG